jgi:hypothetical protein
VRRSLVGVTALLAAALFIAQACQPAFVVEAPPSAAPTLATSRPPASGATITASPAAIRPIPDGFRVRIARLRIDLPIAEGIVQRDVELQQTPEGFAFHLPGSSIPGQAGNTYLYSHARTGMFLALWDARVGDEVVISTPEGRTLRYVVSEVLPRVPPTDVSVAQPTPDERLTLQTSTGPAPADPRFVVVALPRP